MSRPFQTPVIVTSVKTLLDRGLELKLSTRELNAAEKAVLFDLHQKEVWVVFKELPINPEDVQVGSERIERGAKTPGQRLRGVLFILWEQSGSSQDFESWYRTQMETIISKIKEKLDQ